MKNVAIFALRHNNNQCNVLFTNLTKDKAGLFGFTPLHGVVSQLTKPGCLFTSKNCDTMERITTHVRWVEIKKFPGFFISNNGLVRFGKTIMQPKIGQTNGGYLYVTMRSKKLFGSQCIHDLVWDHFGTGKTKGWEIHHYDGNILNNHIDNLRYMPKAVHLRLHGRVPVKSLTVQQTEEAPSGFSMPHL